MEAGIKSFSIVLTPVCGFLTKFVEWLAGVRETTIICIVTMYLLNRTYILKPRRLGCGDGLYSFSYTFVLLVNQQSQAIPLATMVVLITTTLVHSITHWCIWDTKHSKATFCETSLLKRALSRCVERRENEGCVFNNQISLCGTSRLRLASAELKQAKGRRHLLSSPLISVLVKSGPLSRSSTATVTNNSRLCPSSGNSTITGGQDLKVFLWLKQVLSYGFSYSNGGIRDYFIL